MLNNFSFNDFFLRQYVSLTPQEHAEGRKMRRKDEVQVNRFISRGQVEEAISQYSSTPGGISVRISEISHKTGDKNSYCLFVTFVIFWRNYKHQILQIYNINLKRPMKVQDNLSYKLSLRTRLRLSRNLVQSSSKTSKQRAQLSKLSKRSSHIKKIIDRVLQATKQRLRKSQTKIILSSVVKTRSRSKKDLDSHPWRKLVSRNVDVKTFKKFLKEAYEGAVYSAKHLEQTDLPESIKETVQIPEAGNQKYLILDLDETLIHSVEKTENCQVTLPDNNGADIRMNVRPYVREFLQNMSQFYQIYVFTASTKSYAEPILLHLDPNSSIIKGLLCRPSCVLTTQGCYVKDLRLFSEQNLGNVVIIDNYVHSFGLQMENGIPILPFQNNVLDEELKYVEQLLLKLKDCEDVRPHLNEMFQLKKLAEMKKRDLNL